MSSMAYLTSRFLCLRTANWKSIALVCEPRCKPAPERILHSTLHTNPHMQQRLLCSQAARVAGGEVRKPEKAPSTGEIQVLMINRGTPPATDGLCIPGGRLEVGESLAAGAVREVNEETGIDVRFRGPPGPLYLYTDPDADGLLPSPRPITVVDGLYYGDDKSLRYHYVINEMLAVAEDFSQEPVAADDAATAMWLDVDKLDPKDCVPSVVGVVSLGVASLQPGEL